MTIPKAGRTAQATAACRTESRVLERLDHPGAQRRGSQPVAYGRLDLRGTEELIGRGVRYGSPSGEALGYAGGRVAVIGGANSGGQAALHLADDAAQVTMLVRGRLPGPRDA
jgi:hypothetical protein